MLDLAVDSKESAKLREKLERKKEKLLKRKEEHERKQREKSEKRSISHIIGKKRRSDESPGPSSKKFGFSNDLDEVKSRLLDKDQPRIKSSINVDSDAESEITLAPSMVLNEGSQVDKRYFLNRFTMLNLFLAKKSRSISHPWRQ